LGPASRSVSDERHDVRIGAERAAGEYAAEEVEPRAGVEEMSTQQLARRRLDLMRSLRMTVVVDDFGDERRDALDRRIASARTRLDAIAERLAEVSGDEDLTTRLGDRRRQGERQLRRLEQDRDGAPRVDTKPPSPDQVDRWTYELRLIEERVVSLTRMTARAELLEPTPQGVGKPRPRPESPDAARACAERVDLIHGFRIRWGVDGVEREALGLDVGVGIRREARRDAAARLEQLEGKPVLDRGGEYVRDELGSGLGLEL
jgi:hypothetical protein